MSEIRSQATPARDETKRETLARLGMIHLAERYGTRLRLEPSHDTEIRVDITHSGGTESHFTDALDLLESVEAVVEHMGLRKPRTVNSATEAETLAEGSVILTGDMASIALTDLNQPVRVWDAGHGAQCTTDRLIFPATVLFAPGMRDEHLHVPATVQRVRCSVNTEQTAMRTLAQPLRGDASMSGMIPYDEMRRLCGLPDIDQLDLMAVIRKHGLNQAISFMQLTGAFRQQEDRRIQWTVHPITVLFAPEGAG
ncbi:hypothetical protein [Rhodococcus erythropolis]|uniref:hypothetical protein n=1 Tax=Rhodococcus erythropolis TaxID=1833 RepID=UPI0036DA639A